MFDVAVIGAGMAGLVCAQQLSQAGYSVVVVEKSRGLGGRVATRRLHDTCADHGACYLTPKGELLGSFVDLLCQRNILKVWTDTVYELETLSGGGSTGKAMPCPYNWGLRYVAPAGMSAIAKFLASGLDIRLNQRAICVERSSEAIAITPTVNHTWLVTCEAPNSSASNTQPENITATAVVVAIPAPQAFMLLEPLGEPVLGAAFLDNLRSVEFSPCISVMAGYPATSQPLPDWKAINFIDDPDLAWIGFDSSKRLDAKQPHFVVQSSADFAQRYLETQDLQPVGQQMLNRAAQLLLPWLDNPQWMQVHRWRYAFVSNPWQETFLAAPTTQPLVCCGDWCGGNLVEGAMSSGLAAAEKINLQLRHLHLPKLTFINFFNN
jgi:predicted NAD/FAD-dependent oxidoreductase